MSVVAFIRSLIGVGCMAAGAWGLGIAISRVVHYTPIYGLDAPSPPSFSYDAAQCFMSFVLVLSGWAITNRRWAILSLTCWFVLAILMRDSLLDWLTGWHSQPLNRHHVLALALIVILVACHGSSRNAASAENPRPDWRMTAVFAGLASLGFIWRTAIFLTGTELQLFLSHIQDDADFLAGRYATHLTSGIISPFMAAALVAAVLALRKQRYASARVVLAIGMGLTMYGTLETLDAAFSLSETPLFATSMLEAFAFTACVISLASLTPWRHRRRSSAQT